MGYSWEHPLEDFPPMIRIKQRRDTTPRITSIYSRVKEELDEVVNDLPPSSKVALALGSRGITSLYEIVEACIKVLKDRGVEPFIIPAMGSHGGATSQGQRGILASYDITEERLGVPIKDGMEALQIGSLEDKTPVFMGREAFYAPSILLINRIKPHTDFHGPIESGLSKMLAIGLGKEKGALALHAKGSERLKERIPLVAKMMIEKGPILGGLAIVENNQHEPALLRYAPKEEILSTDRDLLELAKEWMPRLPAQDLHILVVERLGKNISGTGMDTTIIGRTYIDGIPEGESPVIKNIVVLGLTKEAEGNAFGLGLADIVTESLVEEMDREITYKNGVTSATIQRVKIPLVAKRDRDALGLALKLSFVPSKEARIIRIASTLHLATMDVSLPIYKEIQDREDIEVISTAKEMSFSDRGELLNSLSEGLKPSSVSE